MRYIASILFAVMLSSASVAHADGLYKTSLVLNVAAHGADLATTEYCLGAKKCVEMNAALARFEQPAVFGSVKMGVAAGSMLLAHKIYGDGTSRKRRWASIAFNFASASAFFTIAAHNARVTGR